jgi:PLP dependent protein
LQDFSGSAADRRHSLERARDAVLRRVADAAARSGRTKADVRLVAVTKTFDDETTAALFSLGCRDLGENRPELLARKAAIPELKGATWHLVGAYQRRKIRDTLRHVSLVHSGTSIELLRSLDARAQALGRTIDVLVEVDLAGEATKQGLSEDEARVVFDASADLAAVRVLGLMSMAPPRATSDALRRLFASVRTLRDRLATPERPLPELSMGMSSDFEEAILEGATIVRIGTALAP